MYQPIASDAKSPRSPGRPAWLRLMRDPLSASERASLGDRHGRVRSAGDVARLLRERALAEEVECFYVLALDTKLRLIAVEEAARGSRAAAVITPCEVFRLAVVLGAFGIILAHNHPSGDPLPSQEDTELTRRVAAAGEVLGIHVLDHVIVAGRPITGADAFFGFRDHGLLGGP